MLLLKSISRETDNCRQVTEVILYQCANNKNMLDDRHNMTNRYVLYWLLIPVTR